MRRSRLLSAALVTLIAAAVTPGALPAAAQSPTPERVEITAPDGIVLVGSYYAPPANADDPARALLLMHHSGGQKEVWIDFIPVAQEAGYALVTVDLRGYGESGGETSDWQSMEADAHLWLAWLRDQPGIDPDRVSIVGSSIGGDLGLRVMVNDEALRTVVSLSPRLDVNGMTTADAMEAVAARPIFFAAGQGDALDAEATRTLFALATGDVQARLYDHGACCTTLFTLERDLAPAVIAWLDRTNK
ncbi:alpha/beta hydrolase [Aggregatilinea lenta]|uniref:alpha/beta hydrolase n=1 Tax=Aggregatilinea lenta TaxID=913108 RepID=UPI000E5C08C3|nr:alpha/beta fold hydrolase [Aggregatilinea lenta]